MTSWAVSRNNGASFMDNGPILPVSTFTNGSTIITNGAPDPTLGDAGDTCMAYDPNHGANGVVYLLLNQSRESGYSGFRLWASTNKGTSFILINTNVPGNVQGVDGPRLKLVGSDLYASGGFEAGGSITCRVWVAHSANGGASWNSFHTLETNFSNGGAEVLQAPGTIYAFWLQRGTTSAAPYTKVFSYAWLSGGSWSSSRSLGITLNSPNAGGSGNPLRFNGDNTNDFFISNGVPFPAFANGRVYLAYADLPSTNSTSDHGDIFLAEFTTNSDHSLSLSAIRKVNNDRTSTDQWNPAIAVNPAGTELFIGYYSRQNDPLTNSWITDYGAKAFVTNGLSQATFECIPISPKNFLPMFAGTNVPSNTWAYDPVWPQGGVCLDTNAMYAGTGDSSCTTCHWTKYPSCIGVVTFNNHVNFSADDYTWAAADSN